MQLEGEVGHLHTEKKYLLAIVTFVRGAEGDRATSPSSASRKGSIDAPRASLEVQMQRYFMQLAGEAGHFTQRKNYLLAIVSFVRGAEGDEATSPSFAAENAAIDASSSSLEALIATRYMQRGPEGSALLTANKISVCRSLIVSKRRGRQGNVALFYSLKRCD